MILPLLLAAAPLVCHQLPPCPASAGERRPATRPVAAPTEAGIRSDRLLTRVMDKVGLLPPATVARVTAASASLERRTGHQYVVVVEPSLHGSSIERFSLALFKRLGVGRACCDDGVGLLIAPTERKARIEVGMGLEDALTNDEAQRIMDHVIIPHFRRGDYGGGVEAGTTAIIAEIDA